MPISETVLVSLITFASGALGLIVGAISTHKAAKLSAKNQLQQIVIREHYAARLSAYQEVFEAHANYLSSDYSKEFEKPFISAVNRACLVSSPKTVVELTVFQNSTLMRTENRVAAVMVAMQKDLAVFTEPEVSESKWISTLESRSRSKQPKPTRQKQPECKQTKPKR